VIVGDDQLGALARHIRTAFPIATPTWAARSAGVSFAPSPVTATKWPWRMRDCTMRSFCCGATRENARGRAVSASSAASPLCSALGPVLRRRFQTHRRRGARARGGDGLAQRFSASLRGILLDGTDEGIDQQHGEDGVAPLLERHGHHRGDEENVDERTEELPKNERRPPAASAAAGYCAQTALGGPSPPGGSSHGGRTAGPPVPHPQIPRGDGGGLARRAASGEIRRHMHRPITASGLAPLRLCTPYR
jgi:hypothetical protein